MREGGRRSGGGGSVNAPSSDGGAPGKRTLTETLFRKGAGAGRPDAPEAVEAAKGSSGAALDAPIRSRVEQATGADLGHVRVHTGAASADAAASVGARAYTVGGDIHFGAGEYRPGT